MKEEKFDLSPEMINDALSTNFTGENDVYLDFQGRKARNLLTMRDTVRRVSYKVENTMTTQQRMAITPASYDTRKCMLVFDDAGTLKVKVPGGGAIAVTNFNADALEDDIISVNSEVLEINNAGHNVDVMFDDGYVYALAADPTKYVKVTAKSPDASASHFKKFISEHPTAFIGLHIVSDTTEMFESELILQNITPFKGSGQQERIPFQDFFTDQSDNTSKIIVKDDYQFDGETLSQMLFPATSEVTITFVASVVQSNAAALRRKVYRAEVYGKKLRSENPKVGRPDERKMS